MNDTNDLDDKAWQKTTRILGTPVFDEFAANTLAIRRNLVIISSFALAYRLNNLSISADSSLFGIKFDSLTDAVINQTFFWLILYHLIHFSWNSSVDLQAWRVRVTGMRLAFNTGAMWTSEEGDYPSDPRQSSLYTWWSENADRFGSIGKQAQNLQGATQAWELTLKQLPESINKTNIVSNTLSNLSEINKKAAELSRKIEDLNKAISSSRIPVSLARFDRWYRLFQWNQIVKWAVIEWGGPLLLGTWAACKTFPF